MGYRGEPEWMNTPYNAMIGFTKDRAKWASNGYMHFDAGTGEMKAWWQNSNFKGGYEGSIPLADITGKMLDWNTQECDVAVKLYVTEGNYHDTDDGGHYRWVAASEHKAIVREDNEKVFAFVGKETYETHGYKQFVEQTAKIVDGELGIGSAFLMDHGGVFVINCELPEEVTTTQGIAHRVKLQGVTSQNTKFATSWKIVDEFSVCSNSFRQNMAGKGNELVIKHTGDSLRRMYNAAEALGLVYKATDEYSKFLDAMTQVEFSRANLQAMIDGLFPVPEAKVKTNSKGVPFTSNQGHITTVDNKRTKLITMYNGDHRVQPFQGTLFGAFQTISTYNQWERPTGDKLEASIMGAASGKFAKDDDAFWAIVNTMAEAGAVDLRPILAVVGGAA